jgi:hypothetical protein
MTTGIGPKSISGKLSKFFPERESIDVQSFPVFYKFTFSIKRIRHLISGILEMRRSLLKPETFCEIIHVKICENALPFTEKN